MLVYVRAYVWLASPVPLSHVSARNILWLNGLCLLCFQFLARVLQTPFCALFWACIQLGGGWMPLTFGASLALFLSLSHSLSVYMTVSLFVCLSAVGKICYKAFASFTHHWSQATQQFIKVPGKDCNWQWVSSTADQCVCRESVCYSSTALRSSFLLVLFARVSLTPLICYSLSK